MSLEVIRDLRRSGQKPQGVVTVLIGQRPRWLDDDAGIVVVRPADDPNFMDWRPMFGLWAAVFLAEPAPARFLAVLEQLNAVQAMLFGAADASGTYPLVHDAGTAHHRNLRKTWELLCL